MLLVVEKSSNPLSVDFGYRIFNADGSEVNQCGNGARSAQHLMNYSKLTSGVDFLNLELSNKIMEIPLSIFAVR